MTSHLDTSDGDNDEFARWSGMSPSSETFAECPMPSPTRRRRPRPDVVGVGNARRGAGLGPGFMDGRGGRGEEALHGREGSSTTEPNADDDLIVPAAEEVLGAIDRDANALAESLSTLIANLRSELATCSGDTVEHLEVHLEASETMHGATRAAVKEASGLVSEVIRVSEEARRLTGLAAQVRETRRALEQFEHVANNHLPPPGASSSSSAGPGFFTQLSRTLSS